MRGKVKLDQAEFGTDGITPAYAGKRQLSTLYSRDSEDHPRLCGEKLITRTIMSFCSGSPPPMRGKADDISNYYLKLRITPAYAGKRERNPSDYVLLLGSPPPMRGKGLSFSVFVTCIWDHPRLCGEKFCHALYTAFDTGSPPPMRGKVLLRCKLSDLCRITPAYAGKREAEKECSYPRWDHPRLCGEKLSTVTSLSCM